MNTTLFLIYLKFIWPKRQECEKSTHSLSHNNIEANNLILRGPDKISQVRIFNRKFIRHIVQDRLECLTEN